MSAPWRGFAEGQLDILHHQFFQHLLFRRFGEGYGFIRLRFADPSVLQGGIPLSMTQHRVSLQQIVHGQLGQPVVD